MKADEYLAKLPKTDLHVHLTGTIKADTFADLARKSKIELPDDPHVIWDSICSPPAEIGKYSGAVIPVPTEPAPGEPEKAYSLFLTSLWAWQTLVDAEDFSRIAYEACRNAYLDSNTQHLEFSVDPHQDFWKLTYAEVQAAYIEGIKAAESEFGMTARMYQAIDRSKSAEEAYEAVKQAVDHPSEYLVGIGLDNLETSGPPQRFVDAYQLAESAGLHRTAHASEHAMNAENTRYCVNVLGCSRIDHGYFVLQDDDVVAEMVEKQVPFTVIQTTSRRSLRPWRRASIAEMQRRGLKLTLNSDDPGMFPTTLLNEYHIAYEQTGLSLSELRQICLNGTDACWLPEDGKKALRASFEAQIAELDAALEV